MTLPMARDLAMGDQGHVSRAWYFWNPDDDSLSTRGSDALAAQIVPNRLGQPEEFANL